MFHNHTIYNRNKQAVSRALLALIGMLFTFLVVARYAQAQDSDVAQSGEIIIQGNPPIDIVFIIDESGSMAPIQQSVIDNVNFIANQLLAFLDPRYALVGFGSSAAHGGGSSGDPHTHTDFTDVTTFGQALTQLVDDGGIEPGVEATIHAMNNLAAYRPGAGVCAVLITNEDSDGGDLATANAALDNRSAVWLGVVNIGTGNTAVNYGPNVGSMSEHTGGSVHEVDTFVVDPQPVLQALLNDCIATVTQGITLTPAEATNPVGTDHTVTATLFDENLDPLVGITVNFEVTAGPNLGETGSCVTDANGQCTFTYTGDGGAGTDTITASFVDDQSQTRTATALKHWQSTTDVSLTGLAGQGSGPAWWLSGLVLLVVAAGLLVMRRKMA